MHTKKYWITVFFSLFLISISLITLIYPAIINHFPMVYSDSGTYMLAAFTKHVPVDRPIGYSIFLLVTSLHFSVWITIVVQAIIVFYILYIYMRDILTKNNPVIWTFVVVILLCSLTALPNFTSQLMPDFFTGLTILSVGYILLKKISKKTTEIILSLIFVISVIGHFSNLLLSIILIILVLLIHWIFRKRILFNPRGIKLSVIWIVFSFLLIRLINLSYGSGFVMARASNVMPMARMIEMGIIKDYLDENCDKKNYSLCTYKDSLPQETAVFLWDFNSVFYRGGCAKNGWGDCWIEKNDEYGNLMLHVLSKPKFLIRYLKAILIGTSNQLIDFDAGVLGSMQIGSAPYGCIEAVFPKELSAYKKAKQYTHNLEFDTQNKIQKFVVTGTFAVLIILMSLPSLGKRIRKRFGTLFLIVFSGLLFNAMICASMSGVASRYQGRIIWLLPFMLFMVLFAFIEKKNLPIRANQEIFKK